jgi:hypothetical protein
MQEMRAMWSPSCCFRWQYTDGTRATMLFGNGLVSAPCLPTANCIIIAQFPIENHSEQGQSAESPLKTTGKSANLGDYCAIFSMLEYIMALCELDRSSFRYF